MIVVNVLKVLKVVVVVVAVVVVAVVVAGMVMVAVLQRAVYVRDATVEVFVGLSNHSPANQHPHIAEENGERIGIAFLRQRFGRNEEVADCDKRRSDTRGGGECKLFKVACHTFLLPKSS